MFDVLLYLVCVGQVFSVLCVWVSLCVVGFVFVCMVVFFVFKLNTAYEFPLSLVGSLMCVVYVYVCVCLCVCVCVCVSVCVYLCNRGHMSICAGSYTHMTLRTRILV